MFLTVWRRALLLGGAAGGGYSQVIPMEEVRPRFSPPLLYALSLLPTNPTHGLLEKHNMRLFDAAADSALLTSIPVAVMSAAT